MPYCFNKVVPLFRSAHVSILMIFLVCLSSANTAQGSGVLTPPNYPASDMHNVNIAGGVPTISQTDLTIGTGKLSLSHRIETFSGYFQGYADNFINGKVTKSSRGYVRSKPNITRDYMQVITGSSVLEFSIDPQTQKYGPMRAINTPDAGQTDPKNTLEDLGSEYLLIMADGTEMYFKKGADKSAHASATLTSIHEPNGFIIRIERVDGRVQSVRANNGLQLKYNYDASSSSGWIRSYPRSIVALNNTKETCSVSVPTCSPSQIWPTVSYVWPGNMPEIFSQGGSADKIFKVTDALGQTTEYVHRTFNAYEGQANFPNPLWYTRLTEIRYPNGEKKTFTYRDKIVNGSGPYGYLTSIQVGDATWGYNSLTPGGDPTNVQYFFGGSDTYHDRYVMRHAASGYKGVKQVITSARISDNFPIPYQISYHDGVEAYFWPAYGNLLDHVIFPEGNKTQYTYNDNNSLIEVKQIPRPGSGEPVITQSQTFSAGTCANRKTCYQPTSVIDGRGNVTNYTYHAQSGQIATVTQPADNNGVRPQTRHRYTQKYAWYKNENGTLQRADTPIWLLTETSTCLTDAPSNYNDVNSGCSKSNDEVITQYDYGPDNQANNLWLRGVKVIHGSDSRLTCYTYDQYGNRVSETQPEGTKTVQRCS